MTARTTHRLAAPLRTAVVAASAVLLLAAVPAAPAAPPAAPPGSSPAASRDVVKIDFPGSQGIAVRRGSGAERRLAGTPRSFKRFVRARLDTLWRQSGSKPRCATAPTVVVARYHGKGFASVGEGVYDPCPAGGNRATYVKQGGRWKAVLGTQEVLPCADLQWFGVPRFIGGKRCATEDWDLVAYRPGAQPRSSAEASARRLASLPFTVRATGIPVSGFATSEAAAKVRAELADGAYLTVEDCGVGGDGSEAGSHLAPGTPGCVLRASYDDNTYAVLFAVPMVTGGDGIVRASDMLPVASS